MGTNELLEKAFRSIKSIARKRRLDSSGEELTSTPNALQNIKDIITDIFKMNKLADQIEYNVHNIFMLLKYLRYTRKDSTQIYGIATELHSLEIKSSVSKFNPYPINSLPERWKELRSKLEHTISVTKDIKINLNLITGIELNIKEIERRLNNI